uniref:NADAR domain-containing protein n=1 Tax=Onchocerca volvulus TaxID=6282 RepID=A0A8R1TMM5_ONCVO
MTNIVTTENGEKFTLFFTIRSPFSNFHPCRFTIFEDVGNGKTEKRWYYSTEQYYMYHKALSAGDSEIAEQIMNEHDARKIKMMSHNIRNFEREAWNKISIDVMRKGNFAKYTQNPLLRKKLFYTYGSTLVECSPTDLEWGIGLDINEPDALSPSKWRGKNKLGQILTEIREELLLKPEYAQEVSDIVSVLENFDSFSRHFFLPPKPATQQCSCSSSVENNHKKRSLPFSIKIDRITDGNCNKYCSLSSYPCAEQSENIPDSNSRNASHIKVDTAHRKDYSQPIRSTRKRNYHMLSYNRDFRRHSDDSKDRKKSNSRLEKKRNAYNNSKSHYGIQSRSGRDHNSSENDRESKRFLKRQRRIEVAINNSRLATCRRYYDCDISSSSSEESSNSMEDIDVDVMKKVFEDPFKSLLEKLRNKKCDVWKQYAARSNRENSGTIPSDD